MTDEKNCEHCKMLLTRKVQGDGKIEDKWNFIRRRFCSIACRNRARGRKREQLPKDAEFKQVASDREMLAEWHRSAQKNNPVRLAR